MAISDVAGPVPFDWRLAARRILRSPMTTLAMIGAGILCGLYYPAFAHAISPVAQLYLNFLKMVVLPYLVSSVIFSITAMVQDPKSVRYLGKVGMAVLVVSFLGVLVSGTLSLILQPGQIENPQSRIELGEFINSQGSVSTDLAFPFQPPSNEGADSGHSILLDLVPNNVFNALASGQTIQVLLFCLLFGLAMGKIPQPSSMSLTQALNAVYRACTVLTNWFIWGLPFATFILIADQTASTGTKPLMLMGGYLLVMGLSCLIFVAGAFAIIAIRSRRSYWTTIKTCQPLLMVAITTRSTVASLPWVINLLSERLPVPEAAEQCVRRRRAGADAGAALHFGRPVHCPALRPSACNAGPRARRHRLGASRAHHRRHGQPAHPVPDVDRVRLPEAIQSGCGLRPVRRGECARGHVHDAGQRLHRRGEHGNDRSQPQGDDAACRNRLGRARSRAGRMIDDSIRPQLGIIGGLRAACIG